MIWYLTSYAVVFIAGVVAPIAVDRVFSRWEFQEWPFGRRHRRPL